MAACRELNSITNPDGFVAHVSLSVAALIAAVGWRSNVWHSHDITQHHDQSLSWTSCKCTHSHICSLLMSLRTSQQLIRDFDCGQPWFGQMQMPYLLYRFLRVRLGVTESC
jgi:hypothetical protein